MLLEFPDTGMYADDDEADFYTLHSISVDITVINTKRLTPVTSRNLVDSETVLNCGKTEALLIRIRRKRELTYAIFKLR